MIHYSAGIASVRSLSLSLEDLGDPLCLANLRSCLVKAMESDASQLSFDFIKSNLTAAEDRVIENFNGWIEEARTQSRGTSRWISGRATRIVRVFNPTFIYVNLSTGTNVLFTLHESACEIGDVHNFGEDIDRMFVSLS